MSGRRKKSRIIDDVEWQCTYCNFKNSLMRKYCKLCDKRHKIWAEPHSPKFIQSPKIICSPKVQAPIRADCQSDTKENIRRRQNSEARKHREDINEFCTKYYYHFQDASFPYSAKSLYFNGEESEKNNIVVQWLRPDNFKETQLLTKEKGKEWRVFDNPAPTDICHGKLENSWLISAMAILAEKPTLVERIMVTQKFNSHGAYQVRLCKDGEWIVVMVDDRLPCDAHQCILYSQMKRKQLWAPLIEKAVAKTYGCYEALASGNIKEGLTILTGSPVEKFCFKDDVKADEIWTLICDARCDGFLISATCGNKQDSKEKITEQQFEKVGLMSYKYYSILDAKRVGDSHRLVSLRNPWGHTSWKGAWSNDSDEWKMFSGYEALGPQEEEEGVFWMPLEEMIKYFTSITICMYQPDWYEVRKKVELPLNSKQQVDIYGIKVAERSEFFVQLFQPCHRSFYKNWSPVDLCVVIAAESPRTSNQKVVVGKIASCSDRETSDFVSTNVTLEPGNYLIAPLSFNKWKNRSAPVNGRIAIHASKRFDMRFPRTSIGTLAQIVIQLAMDKGKTLVYAPGATLFYLKQEDGLVVVGENKSEKYMWAECNITKATGFVSTRGSFLTMDVIPPHHRMVLMIVSNKEKYHYGWCEEFEAVLRSSDELQDWCLENPEAQHVPHITKDIEKLHQLFKID